MDPFDLLGLPAAFDLTASDLERAYLGRAAGAHPDAARDDEADRRAALLNEGRRVLADPELRADALLARLGGPSKSQDKSLPAGFLAEMMETREELEAAMRSGRPGEREKWEAWAGARRREHIDAVAGLFRALGATPSAGALREIRLRLNAWRYTERLIEQLRAG